MIVVATIAILAAIAIPQYNNYTARAQLSEALSLAGAFQTPISAAYGESSNPASCVLPPNSVTSGKYVDSVVATNPTDTSCDILVTMKTGIADKASDKTVTFSYTSTPAVGQPHWACTTDAVVEIAPRACTP